MSEQTHDQAVKRLRRAQKALLVAVSATKAKTELAMARINADSAAIPPNVIADLSRSIDLLESVTKAVERFRLRQLRKVDQLERTNGA